MTVDAKQRPLGLAMPGVMPLAFGYDARGRLMSVTQGTRSLTYGYDANGHLATARNALNEESVFTTDATGRVTKVTQADRKDVLLAQDAVGNLTSVTPADRQAHGYTYSEVDEVTAYTPPAVAGVVAETTARNLDGQVTKAGHSDGSETTVTRDEYGRTKQVTTPWWTNEVTYVAATGQAKSVTRGTQKVEWLYDGFLMTEEKATGVAPATSQWSYDVDFRRASHTLGGEAVTYAYDGDSLLTRAGAATLGRDATTGRLSTLTVGGVSAAFTFSGYGELGSIDVTGLYREGLQYDDAGRLTVLEETLQGTTTQWVFGYDAMGRLTSAAKNGGAATTWSYDGNGNRLSESGVVSTYDAQDRLLSRGATTYGWDALGGRRSKTEGASVTQYVHDGLGALQSVTLPDATVISYEYDGRHRRVAKRRNGVVEKRWVYDGQYRVAAEVDGTGTVTSRFVYGSQSHSPDYLVRGGVTYVYVKSHLGSVKLVVDATTRAVVQRLDYDAWGQVTEDTSPGFQPFGFAGGVYDVDTRLTHFGFRDYDAQAGVWTSKDPIRLVGGLSAFDYAEANPIQLVDRDGLRVVRGAVSSRAFAAYNVWKASGRFSYIWKLLEADPNVDFVLNDKAYGDANAATYRNGCTADGRPQVNIDFFWKNIDSFRRSNPSWSEAGIVVHEFAHAQSYIRNGEAWFDGLYGVDASVTNAVEDAAEYYQDAYDGHPGRLAPGRAP